MYENQHFDLVRIINLSLRAKYLFKYNLDYFIFDGEIVLIDRITGRMLQGTKLQSGLHQAIEAIEDVEISRDMSVMATITFQNLFKQFNQFSGMTGTGKLGEKEFFDLYSKIVVEIPTNSQLNVTIVQIESLRMEILRMKRFLKVSLIFIAPSNQYFLLLEQLKLQNISHSNYSKRHT